MPITAFRASYDGFEKTIRKKAIRNTMQYRPLGKTGINVSVITLGTHQFSGEWAKKFLQVEVDKMISVAGELGINCLDTAECYGDHTVEAIISGAIHGHRKDWIIATKFGHRFEGDNRGDPVKKIGAWSATEVLKQLEDSLRALRTDFIDVYQFHSGTNADFENEGLWKMLGEQVHAGKIRHLGISVGGELTAKHDTAQIQRAPEVGASVVQMVYNRLKNEAVDDALPLAKSLDLGVFARVPLAKGFLSGHYQPGATFPAEDVRSTYSQEFNDGLLREIEIIQKTEVPAGANMAQWALAWCLKNDAVASVIVGCKDEEQVRLNAASV
jgi:myo-inositol catabolism protein IolS